MFTNRPMWLLLIHICAANRQVESWFIVSYSHVRKYHGTTMVLVYGNGTPWLTMLGYRSITIVMIVLTCSTTVQHCIMVLP